MDYKDLDNKELETKENKDLDMELSDKTDDITEFSGEVVEGENSEVVAEPEPTPMESIVELSTEFLLVTLLISILSLGLTSLSISSSYALLSVINVTLCLIASLVDTK